MIRPLGSDADGERDRFLSLLDAAQQQAKALRFWWRDDDAVDVSPALDRLLALARGHDLPLALAVIPKPATHALAERLGREPGVRVLQHGWQHKPHSPDGEKKIELGDHRPLAQVLDELRMGSARLAELFQPRFLPVLVPPWNRISEKVRASRGSAGLIGLSTYGPAPAGDPSWVNTHVDIIDWTTKAAISRRAAYSLLCRAAERRLAGDPAPIGILTHHLIHQEAAWTLVGEILELVGDHPASSWPGIEALFHLGPAVAAGGQ